MNSSTPNWFQNKQLYISILFLKVIFFQKKIKFPKKLYPEINPTYSFFPSFPFLSFPFFWQKVKIVWFLSGVLRVKRITEDNREGCAFDKMQDEAIELSYTRRIWNGWLYWHAGPGRYLTGCTLTQSPKPTSLLITEHFTGYWFPISPKMGAAFFTIHLLNIYPNNFTRVKYLMTLGGLYFFFFPLSFFFPE